MPYFLLNNQKINIENYNDDFLLLKRDQNDNLRDEYSLTKIGQVIYKSDITFIDEVIATDTEICLKLNNSFKEKDIQKLANLNYKSELNKISQNSKTFLMPVCFEEKDDWNTVEKQTNKTKKEIIESIVNLNFDLAMFGFLPGFVYLNGLPPKLYCARKSNPSKYVKPNSLAIGGPYLGIYSIPSPGGWNVIGKCAFSLNNIPYLPPNILNIGDIIRFESVSSEKLYSIQNNISSITAYNGKN